MQHLHSIAFALGICTIAAGPLTAQRTWVVDANNGVGTSFMDLPAAFAAVADGDRILVRTGAYTPGRLDKAVTIVGSAGAIVKMGSDDFEITGIAAGKTCSLQGLAFKQANPFLFQGAVRVQNNSGVVVLADLQIEIKSSRPTLWITNTKAVTLSGCLVRSHMYVERSTVSASRSVFQAYDGPLSAGVWGFEADIELSQCSAFGTNGFSHLPAGWAVRATSSTIVLRGDSNSRYLGGTYNGQLAAASLDGRGSSTLVVDPAIVMTPPPIGFTSITTRRMGSLTAKGGALGSTLDFDIYAPANESYALFVALPTVPFSLPPFGRQWMDLTTEFFLTAGVQGPTEHTQIQFSVPNRTYLRGLALTFQALHGTWPNFSLTNPVMPIVH